MLRSHVRELSQVRLYLPAKPFTSYKPVIPFLTGSKSPTTRFESSKEDMWEKTASKDPISFANHQWG
ncbi:hypothetical protein FVO58_07220 [Metabacillus halosaccharovorans]|nr:hypothetical protein [Metabacillus halosaccharovorans]